MRFTPLYLIGLLALKTMNVGAQDKVVPLYPELLRARKDWKHHEKENRTNLWQTRVVFNVAKPTLTVFSPNNQMQTALRLSFAQEAVFYALSIDSEGFDVARWLAAKGLTCFVLKYRLVECKTDDPTTEIMTKWGANFEESVAPIIKLAMADGIAAVRYVRQHAKEYGIKPDRIGIMGFWPVEQSRAQSHIIILPRLGLILWLRFICNMNGCQRRAVFRLMRPRCSSPRLLTINFALASHSVSLYQNWTAAKSLPNCTCSRREGTDLKCQK